MLLVKIQFFYFFSRTPSNQTKRPVQKSSQKAANSGRHGSICRQTNFKSEWLIQDFQSVTQDLRLIWVPIRNKMRILENHFFPN